MPIKIEKYIVINNEVWQQEPNGQRLVARCRNKNVAKNIARLLNKDLEGKE